MSKKGFAVYHGRKGEADWWYIHNIGWTLLSTEATIFDDRPKAQVIADKVHGRVTAVEVLVE